MCLSFVLLLCVRLCTPSYMCVHIIFSQLSGWVTNVIPFRIYFLTMKKFSYVTTVIKFRSVYTCTILFYLPTCMPILPVILMAFLLSNTKSKPGTSLLVQCLRFCTCHAGGAGSIPCQGTKIPQYCVAWPKKQNTKKKKIQSRVT